ncbi:MAG: hypothetical protein K9M44_04265 [Candidatus Pacebacteria bacterium]|nr:hypothetical protein [Candidatus Paceibacterota bacterium]
MKKIAIFFLMIMMAVSVHSQIDQRLNLILGAGKSGLGQIEQSNFQFGYLDWLPITNFEETAALGVFVQGINVNGRYNEGNYVDQTQRLVLGATGGFMPRRAFYTTDVYFSFNFGYGWGWNKGQSVDDFRSKQDQEFLTGSLYGHLFSDYRDWFFRYKFYGSYSKDLNAGIEGIYQDTILVPQDSLNPWGFNLLSAKLDVDVYKIFIGSGNITLSPKIILGYSNDLHYKRQLGEVGLGIDLFSIYYQNILEVYYSRKFDFNGKNTFDEIGVSVNLINLIREL